ncbi:MAG TPA: 2-dehydropantoate 2-reductase [Chloroflexota bacterium]|jgi:2-dehydropantoate 2-reductase
MRIAVMGAGGTGGYFGAMLAHAGADVTFIARGAHLAAMRAHGLSIKSRLAGDFTVPVRATDDPSQVGPVDLVLFCVKAYDTSEAAALLHPLIETDTVVLPLQNGVDTVERIAAAIGQAHVIGGVALITSTIEEPGVIAQTAGLGKILLGEVAGGTSSRTTRLRNTLGEAGIPAELHTDIRVAMWEKFIFICAFSGVTALTRLPIGAILASPACGTLLRGVMEEVAAVARAGGIAVPDDGVERGWALAARFEPWARGSLYHDLAAGHRLELEALNGTVVRLGRDCSTPTPWNFAIYAALQPYAEGAPTA